MKFFYKNKVFDCKWKDKMHGYWYSLLPGKLTVKMPKEFYKKILKDVKEDPNNNTLFDLINFKIIKSKGEFFHDEDDLDSLVIYDVNSIIDRSIISSEFKNGEVLAHFSLRIDGLKKTSKQEIREILLNQIL